MLFRFLSILFLSLSWTKQTKEKHFPEDVTIFFAALLRSIYSPDKSYQPV